MPSQLCDDQRCAQEDMARWLVYRAGRSTTNYLPSQAADPASSPAVSQRSGSTDEQQAQIDFFQGRSPQFPALLFTPGAQRARLTCGAIITAPVSHLGEGGRTAAKVKSSPAAVTSSGQRGKGLRAAVGFLFQRYPFLTSPASAIEVAEGLFEGNSSFI